MEQTRKRMGIDRIFIWAGGSTVFATTLLDISNASMISEFYSWAMIPLKTATGVYLAWAMNKWVIKPMEAAGGWSAWAKSKVVWMRSKITKKRDSDDKPNI